MIESLPRISGIYIITCTPTSKIYIGSSVNIRNRCREHRGILRKGKHHSRHLQNAWNKYGEENFVFDVLHPCDEGDLMVFEQWYLDTLCPYGKRGFNIAKNAQAPAMGLEVSLETRKKLSESTKAFWSTPEGRAKKKAASTGRIMTDETKEKIAAKQRGVPKPPDRVEKVRQAMIGKKASLETREKMRRSQLGKKMSPESIARTIAGLNKHYIVTTPEGEEIEVFGLAEFCRIHGLNRGNMLMVASGKRTHNHGFKCRRV
jgi:group I intron endonuclease